jgi:periplasmic divalent cation tolerance protein
VTLSSDYVIVLTTLPADADNAATFARTLVEERLAACVNIQAEMQSIYAWEGAVEDEPERQIVIKTTRARLEALWDRVRELHSYEVPEFLVIPVVDGSDAYLRWMTDSTSPEHGTAAEDLET